MVVWYTKVSRRTEVLGSGCAKKLAEGRRAKSTRTRSENIFQRFGGRAKAWAVWQNDIRVGNTGRDP